MTPSKFCRSTVTAARYNPHAEFGVNAVTTIRLRCKLPFGHTGPHETIDPETGQPRQFLSQRRT